MSALSSRLLNEILMLHREPIVRVLLDERDKDFVGELPGLPQLRIRMNLNGLPSMPGLSVIGSTCVDARLMS